MHRLRERPANRKIPAAGQQRILAKGRGCYADFGLPLAGEHLARQGRAVSRRTLRKWRIPVGLWKPRRQRVEAVPGWRQRGAACGERRRRDSSEFRWLEEGGPKLQWIAMIDDATSRFWGLLVEHDSTEENLRTLEDWLRRSGRPLALYPDQGSVLVLNRLPQMEERLPGRKPETQFGRALQEIGIEGIAANSPHARGRIERLFGTLQDRLVKPARKLPVLWLEGQPSDQKMSFRPN